jgi:hypothetical protein
MRTPSHEVDGPSPFFASERRFKVWRYGVGHSQLLLRSLPTEDQPCLDILFEGVLWIELPMNFDALAISRLGDYEGVMRKAGLSGVVRVLPLLLAGSEVYGRVVCGRATASYTPWTVTSTSAESEAIEILWTQLPDSNS